MAGKPPSVDVKVVGSLRFSGPCSVFGVLVNMIMGHRLIRHLVLRGMFVAFQNWFRPKKNVKDLLTGDIRAQGEAYPLSKQND